MTELLERLRARVEAQFPSYLAELSALVAIDSGSNDRPGVRAVGDRIEALLVRLGMTVARPLCGGSGDGAAGVPATVGRWSGNGTLRVLLVGHLDTVFDKGTAAERPFAHDGARATGPGVSDDKGGMLAGVYALDALRHAGWDDFGTVTFVGIPDEEIGSPGSRRLLARLAAEHDVALCLECAREDGSIVIGRKGVVDVVLDVKGRSAHAGIEPERGINAALVAAELAVELGALNGRWDDVTVNVGVLTSGERPNVVPDHARLVLDVRAAARKSYDAVLEEIKDLARDAAASGAEVDVSLRAPAPPWTPSAATRELSEAALTVAARLGVEVGLALTGGAADANILAAEGVAVLDGLGPIGGDDHSRSEWLDLTSVIPRITMLAALVAELASRGVDDLSVELRPPVELAR